MTRARDFANVISGNFDLPAGALDNAGGGGTSFITKTTSSSVASVSFDNLSTDFDSYVFDLDMHPVSDNVYLGVYLLNSSGSVISGSGNYGYQYFDEGTHTNQSSSGIIKICDAAIGFGAYEGVRAKLYLLGRNFTTTDNNQCPPVVVGQGLYSSSVGGIPADFVFAGNMLDDNAQTIRGIQFLFSSGNIYRSEISAYGMKLS